MFNVYSRPFDALGFDLIMSGLLANWQAVLQRICAAEASAQRRAGSCSLLAVSKTFPASAISELHSLGQQHFGENYVQEGLQKIEALAAHRSTLTWHFIGPLQSNKTRLVAECFDWVHSVDRLKLAERLSAQRPVHLPPLQVCLQVNISQEPSKAGVHPAEAMALAQAISQLPRLKLRGLMAIPAPAANATQQRAPFAALRRLRDQLNTHGLALDTLSMGMSNDLEAAVAEGATWVRVGTALFGERPRGNSSVHQLPTT